MIDSKTLTNRDASKIARHTITTRDQREESDALQTSANAPAPEKAAPESSEQPQEETGNADNA